MKFKTASLVAIAILVALMTWQCFTWPVVEMRMREVPITLDIDNELARMSPHERPPSGGEVLFRCLACSISLLLGVALVRALGTSTRHSDRQRPETP